MSDNDWKLFRRVPRDDANVAIDSIRKEIPPWRDFARADYRATTYQPDDDEIEMINAAIYLRRPLLITGNPGVGKSSLIYAVAKQLALGTVLEWPISSRTTVRDGLYEYDAVGRLRDLQFANQLPSATGEPVPAASEADALSRYVRLGPLGTALLPTERPRALLIDEIDKGDVDFANDLLHVFEMGRFEIPEARRIAERHHEIRIGTAETEADGRVRMTTIRGGSVACDVFPVVVLTSNGERELPPAFLRRCLRLEMKPPGKERLTTIVRAHFEGIKLPPEVLALIDDVAKSSQDSGTTDRGPRKVVATDQLLNALYFVLGKPRPTADEFTRLRERLLKDLGE